jgi:nuclear GTP-binding protein
MTRAHVDICGMQHGVLDHAGAARIVLRDWSIGKIARYTMPPGASAPSSSADDEKILAKLKRRKELRKADDVKLVRLQPGEAERRDVLLDDIWAGDEENSEDEANDEDVGDEASGDEDGDEVPDDQDSDSEKGEEDVVEEEEEEEAPELLPPPKRKRTVSFAATPAGGKRQRSSKNRRR